MCMCVLCVFVNDEKQSLFACVRRKRRKTRKNKKKLIRKREEVHSSRCQLSLLEKLSFLRSYHVCLLSSSRVVVLCPNLNVCVLMCVYLLLRVMRD